jgi:DHA1 family bicyclomycin/chloramphenicol resistance-like MFS transporter
MLLADLSSVAAVAFTPAFPGLSKEFHLSSGQSQWMMTLFLIGSAIGRLPYGPMANWLGRKKTLFWGLGISIAGTLLSYFAQTYFSLCLGRALLALGAAAALKITYTMIGDMYTGAHATRIFSYTMFSSALVPGIGTAICGYLIGFSGWRGSFAFLLLYQLFLLLFCFFLPETINRFQKLDTEKIMSSFAEQFRNYSVCCYGILMGLSTAIIFIFSQQAPFIAIDLVKLTPSEYGLLYLVPAIGIAIGSYLSIKLMNTLKTKQAILLGIVIIFFGSLAMGSVFWSGRHEGWGLFVPQIFIQIGDAFIFIYASSEVLSRAKDKSYTSAVVLFISSLCAALGTFLAGIIPQYAIALAITFLVITALMMGFWFKLPEHTHRK